MNYLLSGVDVGIDKLPAKQGYHENYSLTNNCETALRQVIY